MAIEEYHLKQAHIAAHMAHVEPDRIKSAQLQLLALELFEKAEKVKTRQHYSKRGQDKSDYV